MAIFAIGLPVKRRSIATWLLILNWSLFRPTIYLYIWKKLCLRVAARWQRRERRFGPHAGHPLLWVRHCPCATITSKSSITSDIRWRRNYRRCNRVVCHSVQRSSTLRSGLHRQIKLQESRTTQLPSLSSDPFYMDHVPTVLQAPGLSSSYWIPLKHRIVCKVAVVPFKVQHTVTPAYRNAAPPFIGTVWSIFDWRLNRDISSFVNKDTRNLDKSTKA